MTQEDKKLLLKDLCARIPYHPRIHVINQGWEGCQEGEFDTDLWMHHVDALWFDRIEVIPYLRPLSSMTEEEREEYNKLVGQVLLPDYAAKLIDWLNAHHFDYRGLIEKGLALEAPEGMYELNKK